MTVTATSNPLRDGTTRRGKVLFLNRSYWPDAEATGQLLTELCEDIADDFDVTVLAGQPNQNPLGESFVANGREVRNNVRIERVRNSRFRKRSLIGKLWNFLSFLWFAWWRTFRIPRQDVIVCETDPFLLPFLAVWLRFRHRARLVIYLQDIYPDIAVAVGKAREGLAIRTLRRMLRWCYRRAETIVVLSDDMRQTLIEWDTLDLNRIKVIPNWVDTSRVASVKVNNPWRREHNLEDQFVVMYSGNLGLSQDLHVVLESARELTDCERVTFLFVGDGASRESLERAASAWNLKNVRFLPYQPKERLSESLSAADLHLLPIRAEALRCLMPSKLYGILASGTAVLSIAPERTELARVVREERVGRNLAEFRADLLSVAIRELSEQRGELAEMGRRARQLAVERYDRRVSVGAFTEELRELCDANNRQGLPADSPYRETPVEAAHPQVSECVRFEQ